MLARRQELIDLGVLAQQGAASVFTQVAGMAQVLVSGDRDFWPLPPGLRVLVVARSFR